MIDLLVVGGGQAGLAAAASAAERGLRVVVLEKTGAFGGSAALSAGILWTAPDGLAANTRYTITIPTTVTDRYQRAAASAFEVSFTTGGN